MEIANAVSARIIGDCRGAIYAELAISLLLLLPLLTGVVNVSIAISSAMDLLQASRILTRNAFHAESGAITGAQLCTALTGLADSSLQAVGLDPNQYSVQILAITNVPASTNAASTTQAMQIIFSPAAHSTAASYALVPIRPFPAYVAVNAALALEMGACQRLAAPIEVVL